jgi:hypothetical protein
MLPFSVHSFCRLIFELFCCFVGAGVNQGRWELFTALLAIAKIKPKKEVLDRIAERHYAGIDAAASSQERAVTFYEMIRDMPSTSTRVVLQEQLQLYINGPVSVVTPDILTAMDEAEDQFILKILRPRLLGPAYAIQKAENVREAEVCLELGLSTPSVALCPVEVIPIHYEDRNYTALKMPRFLSTLYDLPRVSHGSIANHGRIIVEAVQYMHTKGFVHMDIKSDNIFVGANKSWVLGDFGSAKRIGEPITTSNLVDFAPFRLVCAEVKFDWYMLLLTLLKESLESWDQWVTILCDENEKYNAKKINEQIRLLENGSLLQTLLLELQDLAGDCCK